MALARVEPFEFFTKDALSAGWYLSWRLWLRLLVIYVPVGILSAILMVAGAPVVAPLVFVLAIVGSIYFVIRWTNAIASQWTEQRYGRALTEGVWWGIFWRSMLVSIAMSVGVGVAQFLFSGAFALVASILSFGLAVAQIVLTLLATGWALSVMVARQLGGSDEVGSTVSASPAAPRPVAAPSAPDAPRPAAVAANPGEKRQCPKCKLSETEHGSVIGWYCRVCGWRESQG